MQNIKTLALFAPFIALFSSAIHSKSVSWCVYDLAGQSGEAMQIMKDYGVAAKNWGVDTVTKVYLNEQQALSAFKNKQCDALVASTFSTREFNHFTGTIGAIGLIPNHHVAQQLFLSLGQPTVAKYMVQNGYESVGWIPIGPAYFMVKDRNINSITQLAGRKVGVLKEDPSQERVARRVGAIPIFMTLANAGHQFVANKIEILAAPIYAYRPLELHRGLGHRGGVINFPISYVSLSLIIRQNAFPTHYGMKSRAWFQARTPKMMQRVIQWEKSMPNKYWYDIPIADRSSYQRLVAQLRKEFVESGLYNRSMLKMVLSIHCAQNDKYFECQK